MSPGIYLIARIGQYYIRGEFGIIPIQRSSRSSAATWLAYTCTRVSISAGNENATGISYIVGQFLKNYIQPNLPESPSSWDGAADGATCVSVYRWDSSHPDLPRCLEWIRSIAKWSDRRIQSHLDPGLSSSRTNKRRRINLFFSTKSNILIFQGKVWNSLKDRSRVTISGWWVRILHAIFPPLQEEIA